jgi:signal peptidase II
MKKTYIIIIFFIFLIFVSDRISKNYIKLNFTVGESIEIIGTEVRLTYIKNEGIAFGMFQEYGNILFILTPLSFLLIIFYFIKYENKNFWTTLAFTLIIGGAIGNIYDRIVYGAVIDFIDVNIPDINLSFYQLHRWPIFNIADFAISTGIIVYLLYSLFFVKKNEY